jgi:hypothetical protein
MKKLIETILSYLLHYANSEPQNNRYSDSFYKIKDKILTKYATLLGTDIQHIEPKICFKCDGTGTYIRQYDGSHFTCWDCVGSGIYKDGFWTVLNKYQFGNYTFHIPKERLYVKPEQEVNIVGYINHKSSKYGYLAMFMIMLLFSKGYLAQRYNNANSWCYPQWKHRNWLSNILHLMKYRFYAIPIRTFIRKLDKYYYSLFNPKHEDLTYTYEDSEQHTVQYEEDEIPF